MVPSPLHRVRNRQRNLGHAGLVKRVIAVADDLPVLAGQRHQAVRVVVIDLDEAFGGPQGALTVVKNPEHA